MPKPKTELSECSCVDYECRDATKDQTKEATKTLQASRLSQWEALRRGEVDDAMIFDSLL